MMKPTYPSPSKVAIDDYNTRIRKQIIIDNTKIANWTVTEASGTSATANVTLTSGVVRAVPITRVNLSTLFPANEKGYHIVSAKDYDKFSGSYVEGQSYVTSLLAQTNAKDNPFAVPTDTRLEKALMWLWVKLGIYIPITDITAVNMQSDTILNEDAAALGMIVRDAYRITANLNSLGLVGSVDIAFTSKPVIEGFEFTVMSPEVENTGARFALVLEQTATDWAIYENDEVVVSLADNKIGATVTSIPGKATVVFNNLRNTTKTYVVKATGGTLTLENHVATTRNVVVKSFIDTVPRYLFKLPTVDLTVPTKLPSTVTNLSSMFNSCSYFNQDLSMWDVSNVTDFTQMFAGCVAFNQPLNNWNTSKVTTMASMFYGCRAFNQPIGNWDTSKVTTMSYMFYDCIAFNQPLNNWNTSKVTTMSYLFYGCSIFNQPLNTWDVSQVIDMSGMFSGCTAFNRPIGNWDVSRVTTFNALFSNAISFDQPLNDWNVSSAKNMTFMFAGAKSFNQDLDRWNTINVTDMSVMFGNSAAAFNGNISTWNTSKVITMSSMFSGAIMFNSDISMWNVSSVVSMTNMFTTARSFNQNIGNWNTSNVTLLQGTFSNATAFNQNIGSWDTSKVTTMYQMFSNALAFNQPIGNWNTSKVTTMSSMFTGATSFNQNLSNWNTGMVTNMSSMFRSTAMFNGNISTWDVSQVTNMSAMFAYAPVFNQDLTNWNTSEVTSMFDMFQGANLFNKDISMWDVSKVSNMSNMFWGAAGFNQDLSEWCVSKLASAPTSFSGPGNVWTLPKPVWGTCPARVPAATPFSFDVNSTNDWVNNNNITLTALAPTAGWSLKRDGVIVASSTVTTTPGITVTTVDTTVTIVIEALRNEMRSFVMSIAATQLTMSYTADQPGMAINVSSFSSAVAGYKLNVISLLTVPTVLPTSVTTATGMFSGARKFNQDISMWDTSRVTNMSSMFSNAWAFNMPLNTWNTANVTNMNSMFYTAKVFNQNISAWNVSKVTDMNYFASGTAFNQDLSQWCVTLIDSLPAGFSVAATHVLPKPVWGTCPRGEAA